MKRHSLDVTSLIFGLAFLGIAGWWAVARLLNVRLDIPNFGWFAAGGLIVLGLLGVVASLRRGKDETRPDAPTIVEDPRPTVAEEVADEPRLDEPATDVDDAPTPYRHPTT